MIVMFLAAGFAKPEDNPGVVRGSIITIESDGARSVIPAAAVTIESAELSRKTTADEQGSFGFGDLPAGVSDPGQRPGTGGFGFAEVTSGQSVDVQVVMEIELSRNRSQSTETSSRRSRRARATRPKSRDRQS